MENNKTNTVSIIVLIAALACMVAAIVFKDKSEALSVMFFGIFFTFFGLLGYVATKENIVIIFPTIGTFMIYYGAYNAYLQYAGQEFVFNSKILGLCIFLVGFIDLMLITIKEKFMINNCDTVSATCVDLDSKAERSKGHKHNIYAPTWYYKYKEVEYTVKSNSYTNINVPAIGENRDIYIVRDNPETFYNKNKSDIIIKILSVLAISIGIVLILI